MRCPICHDEMEECANVQPGKSLLARSEAPVLSKAVPAQALYLCGEHGYYAEPVYLIPLGHDVVDMNGLRWSSMPDSERLQRKIEEASGG